MHNVKLPISARHNVIFLRFLHHLKAHTQQFSVRCQHKPNFFHELSSWIASILWSFQRSCFRGFTVIPAHWKAFCWCLPVKTRNAWWTEQQIWYTLAVVHIDFLKERCWVCVCKKVQSVILVTTVQQSQFDAIKCGYYLSKPCGMSLYYRSTTQTVYTVC